MRGWGGETEVGSLGEGLVRGDRGAWGLTSVHTDGEAVVPLGAAGGR